jgi:CHAT domain-containing protein
MRPESHLSEEQLFLLVERSTSPRQEEVPGATEWMEHVGHCEFCSKRISAQRELVAKLAQLRMARISLTPQCHSEEAFLKLSAGLLPDSEKNTLLWHVAKCDKCAETLRKAIEITSDVLTPEEENIVAGLRTSDSGWQRTMAQELRLSSVSVAIPDRGRWHIPRIAWALMAACTVTLAFILVFLSRGGDEPQRVNRLLAEAYDQDRWFEMRIANAQPTKMAGALRGPGVQAPASLREAQGILGRHLAKDPDSPQWLALNGRAELLDNNLQEAIPNLERASQSVHCNTVALTDLATAYTLRAEAGAGASSGPLSGSRDLRQAYASIAQAVACDPRNSVALFNKGLIEERLGMLLAAATSYRSFLSLESIGPWADVARTRLAALEKNISLHQQSPHFSPSRTSSAEFAYESEDYLDLAVRKWILRTDDQATLNALRRLGAELKDQHNDGWLSDLVTQTRDPEVLRMLAAAAAANAEGDYRTAVRSAVSGESLLSPSKESAALSRLRFEAVYALHRTFRGKPCSYRAQVLGESLETRPYPWLRGQIKIEAAICHNFVGDLGAANRDIAAAMNLAERNQFRTLRLRAIGIQASLATQQGNPDEAWDLCLNGLRVYWSRWAPPMRAYHFLSEMQFSAESSGQWPLARALQNEAVETIERDDDLDLQAMAHFRFARVAVMTGESQLAASEFARAAALFRRAPDQETARIHQVESRIGYARILLRAGDRQGARVNLAGIRPLLREVDPYFLSVGFYETLGDLEYVEQKPGLAEVAYSDAIRIAEPALLGLTSTVDRLRWIHETEHSYRQLVRLAILKGDTRRALNLWEWYKSGAIRHAKPMTLWDELPQHPHNAARAVYAMFSDGIAIWGLGNHYEFHWIGTNLDRFDEQADTFMGLCRSANADPKRLIAISRQLSDWLVRPLEAYLSHAYAIVIEPDSSVRDLPFEVLLDAQGQFLNINHSIVYSPGLAYDSQLPVSTIVPNLDRALIVRSSASPAAGHKTPRPIPGRDSETDSVRSVFRRSLLIGEGDARGDRIAVLLSRAQIFHFIGHGSEFMTGTALIFPNQAMFTSHSINPAGLREMKLVVLSACSTARGSGQGLLDPNSLVHGFLAAGARGVIASRWDVDSSTTATLMHSFYENIAAGANISEALHDASADLRQTNKQQPFYWAAFSVYARGPSLAESARQREIRHAFQNTGQ